MDKDNKFKSYIQDWEKISGTKDIKSIKYPALELRKGLGITEFRSVCWRLFLNNLPVDSSKVSDVNGLKFDIFIFIFFNQWKETLRKNRDHYENLRQKYAITPDMNNPATDPNINNPLSQDSKVNKNFIYNDLILKYFVFYQSIWNQHFENSGVKQQIKTDVDRLYQDIEFFQSQKVKDMIISILFCYTKNHMKLNYIQVNV